MEISEFLPPDNALVDVRAPDKADILSAMF